LVLTDPVTRRIQRRAKPPHPAAYLAAVEKIGQGVPPPGRTWTLQEKEVVLEFAMNSLRLTAGFPLSLFKRSTGLEPIRLAAPLAAARQAGLLEVNDDWIGATELGQRFLNDVIVFFMDS